MKKFAVSLIFLILTAGSLYGQDTYYSIFSYDHYIPRVNINDRSATLQVNLVPDLYRGRTAVNDMNWVAANDSGLIGFWESKGDTVLHLLCELSGIEWVETEFNIYLVRYFPTIGSPHPLIIPLGGITKRGLIKAMPNDNRLILDLIFQLAGRMLDQSVKPEDSIYNPVATHPLMSPGPYRRDNLVMLLALAVSQNVIGYDSTLAAFESMFWKQNMPGLEIFKKHFYNKWVLTPDQPLADQILAEPFNSRLVALTRAPRKPKKTNINRPRQFVEELPLQGTFGFSVKINEANQLEVHRIDTYRLAYACGLREGDRIRRVNGLLVKNHKDLIEKIYTTFDEEGATLQILREDNVETIVLQPLEIPVFEDEFYEDFYPEEDTLYDDSLLPTDSQP